MAEQITIRLPDGSTRALAAGTTAGDLAAAIGSRLAKAAVIAVVNGVERDLVAAARRRRRGRDRHRRQRPRASSRSATPRPTCWPRRCSTCSRGPRSASARRSRTASTTTSSCPAGPRSCEDDLERIEARMREIIAESQPFVRDELAADEAREVFAGPPFKLEIIDDASRRTRCRRRESGLGAHLREPAEASRRPRRRSTATRASSTCAAARTCPTPARLGHFKLMRVAGAYWRGDEKQPELQRIYGTAWARRRRSRRTCTGSRRPPSATTASSASSSTCSASPTRSARASPCSTRRAASSAG